MSQQIIMKTACRRCGADLPIGTKLCDHCGATQKFDKVPIIFIVLLLCSSFLLMSSSYVTVKQTIGQTSTPEPAETAPPAKVEVAPEAPKDISQAAYAAAKRYVLEKYPQAKRISEINQSAVQQSGNSFTVTLFVDGANGGELVRNVFLVKMDYDKGNWKLIQLGD